MASLGDVVYNRPGRVRLAQRGSALPVERKPLFRPDVLRQHLAAFAVPPRAQAFRPKLDAWADLISSGKADWLNEKELLPDFLRRCSGTPAPPAGATCTRSAARSSSRWTASSPTP
jgi:hypothetical protein